MVRYGLAGRAMYIYETRSLLLLVRNE